MLDKLRYTLAFLGLKQLLLHLLLGYEEKSLLGTSKEGYLYDIGYQRSLKEKTSVDKDGKPIPWLTYPAIEFLGKYVKPEMTMYEYGAGASTLWFSKRIKKIISAEHDKKWYEKIKKELPNHCEINHYNLEYGGDYCQSITQYNQKYDIILVDGRDRVNCVKYALEYIKPDGIIILDNSDRGSYSEAIDYLKWNNFLTIDFVGLAPGSNVKTQTSIFKKCY